MELEKASVAPARNTLSSLINKVLMEKHAFYLESQDKPKSALTSTEDLEKLEQLEAGGGTAEVHLRTSAGAPSKD